MQTCKGSRIWNIVSVKSWGRPRLQGGRRKPREGTQGGPRGRSGGGRKAEPEAPGPSRTSMAHLDPAAHHRAHGYADMPPRQSSLSAAFSSALLISSPNQNQRFHLEMSISCRERGWLLVGTELARRRRAAKARTSRGRTRAGPRQGCGACRWESVGRDPGQG